MLRPFLLFAVLVGSSLFAFHISGHPVERSNQAATLPQTSPLATLVPDISATVAPTVTFHSYDPANERRPTIRMQFNREMDTATVEQALNVEPATGFDMQWEEVTLLLRPQESLAPGAIYVFSLADSAADRQGMRIEHDQRWKYQVADLNVMTWVGPDRANDIVIGFNYAMDEESVESGLVVEPVIAGELSWNNEHTVLTLQPASTLPGNMPVTFRFDERLQLADGYELAPPDTLYVTTPPSIRYFVPAHRDQFVNPVTAIEVPFDRPMDRAATAAAFGLTPAIEGLIEWRDDQTLVFRPRRGYLDEYTAYTVSIAATATDADGTPVLARPFAWSFQTTQLSDLADFGWGPNAQVVDADGRRAPGPDA